MTATTSSWDVGIVGAGAHGAAAALALAEAGASVVLVEREHPAAGPTGRSSAVCRAYYTNALLAEVAHESIRLFEEWSDVIGGSCGFHRTGALFLHPEADRPHVVDVSRMLGHVGTSVELLERDDLGKILPAATLDGVGFGVWESGAGHADPAGSTTSMYERARALGAVSRLRTTACAIDGTAIVTTDGERIACGKVLITAGPWTAALARGIGVDLPLTVERHAIVACGWGALPRIPFVWADLVSGHYAKPEGPLITIGSLREGPTVEADHFESTAIDQDVEDLLGSVTSRFPTFDELEVRTGWASLYDVCPDWQPVIGEIADGVFVNAGSSGHGFKLAPALGRHVASLVLGAECDPRLDDFHPRRFSSGVSLRGGFGDVAVLG